MYFSRDILSLNIKCIRIEILCNNKSYWGTPLVAQWLRFCTPSAGGPDLGNEIPHAATKSLDATT